MRVNADGLRSTAIRVGLLLVDAQGRIGPFRRPASRAPSDGSFRYFAWGLLFSDASWMTRWQTASASSVL
jgi:hypothetical protein